MESLKRYIDGMNQLLDELIDNAKKLKDVSKQVISEEELVPLQRRQEELFEHLENMDAALHKEFSNEIPAAQHKKIHDKLEEFQKINQEFVNNLRSSHGLIQFELRRLKEENKTKSKTHKTEEKM